MADLSADTVSEARQRYVNSDQRRHSCNSRRGRRGDAQHGLIYYIFHIPLRFSYIERSCRRRRPFLDSALSSLYPPFLNALFVDFMATA